MQNILLNQTDLIDIQITSHHVMMVICPHLRLLQEHRLQQTNST